MNTIEEAIKELNESERFKKVKRSLFGDPSSKIRTFVIITPENPLAWRKSEEDSKIEKYKKWLGNKKEYNSLSREEFKKKVNNIFKTDGEYGLRYSGASYVKIKGFYDEREISYIIFNITKQDGETLAASFGQESFFFGIVSSEKSKIGYYTTEDYGRTYHLKEITETIETVPDAERYFSKFGFKWKFSLREFGDNVPEVKNNGEFEESLSEERNFKSRALHRRKAY